MRAKALLLAVTLLFLAAPARADDPPPDPIGKAHFDEGKAAYKTNQFAKALDEFRMAYDILHRFNIQRNIGVTLRALGHNADAISALQLYLHDGGASVDPDDVVDTERAISEMMPLVGTVVVKVTHPAGSPDPAWLLTINDNAIDDALARQAIPLDPGSYSFRVHASGFSETTTTVQVTAGQRDVSVALDLKPETAHRGSLRLATNLRTSEIFVDGSPPRFGQWSGSLTPGVHQVSISARGYEGRVFAVCILENKQLDLHTVTLHLALHGPRVIRSTLTEACH